MSASQHPGAAAPKPTKGACPWVLDSALNDETPATLAREVVAHMSLAEEAGFVVLVARDGYENVNSGVPALCIPPLTLDDGPDGIAYGTPGVTQLPSSLGVAASFDTSLAYRYGEVEGAEARRKGIDAVQGPNLNLLRQPLSGRAFEGYGEDPTLVSAMGVADIEGIQHEGVMADAKHLGAYNEETARVRLDQIVSPRALEELYLAPFRAAIVEGHVASMMCSYGAIDGVNTCSDPLIYRALRAAGFDGFVRSDLGAVRSPAAAFRAGLDLIKPASTAELEELVARGAIRRGRLNAAVETTLREMFAYGLIAHPRPFNADAPATSPAHAAFATAAAEQSAVLLENDGVLPLKASNGSVAVLGADAEHPLSAGFGSAYVLDPAPVRPLESIRRVEERRAKVLYAPGGPRSLELPPIARRDFVHGSPLAPPPARHHRRRVQQGTEDLGVLGQAAVTPAAATAIAPGTGGRWRRWQAVVVAPSTGLYEISLTGNGDTWLSVDHSTVLASPGLHGRSAWATTVRLVRGRRTTLSLRWFAVPGTHVPSIGWEDVSPLIAAAAAAARRARTAIVFVDAPSGEGSDRPTLELPGDEDALIAAVAKANPRTVVVVNSGGAVLMPWRSKVAAIVEDWYPGEGDGAAIAAVLFGRYDPSGRLPITFPPSDGALLPPGPSSYPGVDSVVRYDEGLDIGYRYAETRGVTPIFPFGYGLSYTTFSLSDLVITRTGNSVEASVEVANTGRRFGSDVVECYLRYPLAAGEPPEQLRAFASVPLQPGETRTVRMTLDKAAFEADLAGTMRTVPGTYTVEVGPSSADLVLAAPTPAPR